MIAPATTRVTLGYGVYGQAGYTPENPHAGVDFSWEGDNQIYAPEDADVTFTGWMGAAGNATELTAGAHKHRMCHQSQILVATGQRVKKGQVIGVMGGTGNAIGVHLHWIMWVNGTRVNGLDYVNEMIGGDIVIPDREHLDDLFQRFAGRNSTAEEQADWIGKKSYTNLLDVLKAQPRYKQLMAESVVGRVAVTDNWQQQITDLHEAAKNDGTKAEQQVERIRAIINS